MKIVFNKYKMFFTMYCMNVQQLTSISLLSTTILFLAPDEIANLRCN